MMARRRTRLVDRAASHRGRRRTRDLALRLLSSLSIALLAPLSAAAQRTSAQQPAPPYRIAGVIVDASTGAPVSPADVSISVGDDETKTTVDQDGRFSFEGVEPGKKYRLYAAALGYVSESYDQHESFSTAIAVGDGLDSQHIVFRLHPQAVIFGVVTDERGEPVRHAQVTLFVQLRGRAHPGWGGQTQTNDLGEYRFAHLREGKYYLVVEARPWYAQPVLKYAPDANPSGTVSSLRAPKSNPEPDVVYPITFYPGTTDEREAAELDLSAGGRQEANIQLTPVPAVHLCVVNLPSDPARGVYFGANQSVFGTQIGGVPSLSFTQISPGEYEVTGLPPNNVALKIYDGTHERPIQAGVGAIEMLDAAAAAGATATVSGRVIFPPGLSAPDRASVMLLDDQYGSPPAPLHKDGTFSFASVQPGTYRVDVQLGPHHENYVEQLSASGAKASGREITIETASDVQLTITMGGGLGRLTGTAQLDGKPAAGVMVLLVPDSGQNPEDDSRMDQSDSDGTFALPNIIPGKYILMAIDDGWDLDRKDPAVLKPYREKGQPIQVAAGQTQKVTVEVLRRIDAQQPDN